MMAPQKKAAICEQEAKRPGRKQLRQILTCKKNINDKFEGIKQPSL